MSLACSIPALEVLRFNYAHYGVRYEARPEEDESVPRHVRSLLGDAKLVPARAQLADNEHVDKAERWGVEALVVPVAELLAVSHLPRDVPEDA